MTFPTSVGKYRPIDLVSGMQGVLIDAILNSPCENADDFLDAILNSSHGNVDDFRCLADYFAYYWIESRSELDHFQPPSEERVGEILHRQGIDRARENFQRTQNVD